MNLERYIELTKEHLKVELFLFAGIGTAGILFVDRLVENDWIMVCTVMFLMFCLLVVGEKTLAGIFEAQKQEVLDDQH